MSDIPNEHDCSANSPQHVLQQVEVSSSYVINLHKLYTYRHTCQQRCRIYMCINRLLLRSLCIESECRTMCNAICEKIIFIHRIIIHVWTIFSVFILRSNFDWLEGTTMPCDEARVWLRRPHREISVLFTSARGWISVKTWTHNGTPWHVGYG